MSAKPRVNLILDSLILLVFLLTILSGLDLEQALRKSFEIRSGFESLHLHSWAAFTFIGLIVIHQFFHWKWILSQIKQLVTSYKRREQGQLRQKRSGN